MQGFVVGYVGKKVSDKTTLITSVVIVSLSYLVLVRGCGIFEGGALCDCLHSVPDGDIHTPPAVSHSHSDDNGRGTPQHTHQQCHYKSEEIFAKNGVSEVHRL